MVLDHGYIAHLPFDIGILVGIVDFAHHLVDIVDILLVDIIYLHNIDNVPPVGIVVGLLVDIVLPLVDIVLDQRYLLLPENIALVLGKYIVVLLVDNIDIGLVR